MTIVLAVTPWLIFVGVGGALATVLALLDVDEDESRDDEEDDDDDYDDDGNDGWRDSLGSAAWDGGGKKQGWVHDADGCWGEDAAV